MCIRKIASLLICGVVMMTLLSCGETSEKEPSAEKPSKKTTISIWVWDEYFNIVACNEAKKLYAEINPDVDVNIVNIAQDEIILKLHTGLSAGVYDNLPDILLMEDYKIQNFLNLYPQSFKDLTDIVDPTRFMDYKLNVLRKDGRIYGVPFDSGVTALFYRTDYLEEAGYSKEDMTNITWEEYIEMGKKVKQLTGKYMLSLDPGDLAPIKIMIQSAGEWYVE